MRWLSSFSLKEWLFAAVLLGGISAYALHHSNQRTSDARSAAIQVLFADMQYVSILNANAKAFNQENGANQCPDGCGLSRVLQRLPRNTKRMWRTPWLFDNMTISDEMKQANLVFIENNTYSIVGYGSSDSPEALMQANATPITDWKAQEKTDTVLKSIRPNVMIKKEPPGSFCVRK